MTTVELFHLRRVRNKPLAASLLAQHAGLTAEAALALVYDAVGGGKPRVAVASDDVARRLIIALSDTGFIARRAATDGFDAAQLASQVMAEVLPRCAPDVANAAGVLLLQDDWMQALALALQHLRMHRAVDDPDRQRLERAAIDTGLVRGVPGRT